ncbi:MAG: uroporphyrinogen decarboxylase family protein [Thermoguttaceae bacterium]
MTSRERVLRTLNHRPVDRAPRDLWLLPGVETDHADEVAEINIRFPADIQSVDLKSLHGKRSKGLAGRGGHYTDPWGCTWHIGPRGTLGPLVESPLADREKIASYEPPWELLDVSSYDRVGRMCDGLTRFVLARSDVRPLDRLRLLRGAEAAVNELDATDQELVMLLARLHEHGRRELELWAATDVDGVALHDDLASDLAQRVTPRTWRHLLKPLYREYCEILHARDKFVFFQSAGPIADIFADLVEIGCDAIHVPLVQVELEKLAEKYRGKTTLWGEIGRQCLDPPSTVAEIRAAVLRVRKALDFGQGGIIAQCSWAANTPLRNIAAFFEQWMMPLPVGA